MNSKLENFLSGSLIISSLGSAAFICIYPLYTFFNWSNSIENNIFVIQSVESTPRYIGQNDRMNYAIIGNTDGKNPENVVVRKDIKIETNLCYFTGVEGYKSFYQQRWVISAKEIPCSK